MTENSITLFIPGGHVIYTNLRCVQMFVEGVMDRNPYDLHSVSPRIIELVIPWKIADIFLNMCSLGIVTTEGKVYCRRYDPYHHLATGNTRTVCEDWKICGYLSGKVCQVLVTWFRCFFLFHDGTLWESIEGSNQELRPLHSLPQVVEILSVSGIKKILRQSQNKTREILFLQFNGNVGSLDIENSVTTYPYSGVVDFFEVRGFTFYLQETGMIIVTTRDKSFEFDSGIPSASKIYVCPMFVMVIDSFQNGYIMNYTISEAESYPRSIPIELIEAGRIQNVCWDLDRISWADYEGNIKTYGFDSVISQEIPKKTRVLRMTTRPEKVLPKFTNVEPSAK